MASPDFSIVIPHYNDIARLERCLIALMPQVEGAEVIVVDNGSMQDVGRLQERWPQLRLVVEFTQGAGPARNAGAAIAQAPWLAFLDADCVPEPDWLSTARRIASEGTILGGSVTLFDETPRPRSGAEAFEAVFAFQVGRYLEKGFLPSCQLIMSKDDFVRVGRFRADLAEDVDWSRRATAAGLQLAVSPELVIAHPTRSDWPALRKKWRRLTSEEFRLEVGSVVGRLRWAGKALLMPFSVMVHAPRVLRHPDLTIGEKVGALTTLARLRLTRMIWMLGQTISGHA